MELVAPEPTAKKYTVAEYFKLAEASPTKLEFKAGRIIDMAGATFPHNQIVHNLNGELRNRLKGTPCQAGGNDLRVWTDDDRYCYPDVVVVCGEPSFLDIDKPQMTLTNPQVLIEVLSPSTESADRGEKFFRYIRLPSLMEYFLVAQDKPRIESFFRQPDGSWGVRAEAEGMGAVIPFKSLGVEIPMAEIYTNVRFEASNA